MVDQVLDVLCLLVGECTAGADGTAGAVTGQGVRPLPGVGRPPAGNGLPREPEQVGDIGFGEAQLTAVNGTEAESFEDLIGQLAGVG